MDETAKPDELREISIPEFIDGQLGMLSRRMKPEQRAKVRWYRDRIAILAKQEPGSAPVTAEHPGQTAAAA